MTENERKVFEGLASKSLLESSKLLERFLKDGDYFIHIVISKKEPTTDNPRNTTQIYNQGRLIEKTK